MAKLDVTETHERGSIKRGGKITPTSVKVKARGSKRPEKVGKCAPANVKTKGRS